MVEKKIEGRGGKRTREREIASDSKQSEKKKQTKMKTFLKGESSSGRQPYEANNNNNKRGSDRDGGGGKKRNKAEFFFDDEPK